MSDRTNSGCCDGQGLGLQARVNYFLLRWNLSWTALKTPSAYKTNLRFFLSRRARNESDARAIFSLVLVFSSMKLFVNFLEVWVGDMGVDLGGGDIAMTQHGLDTA